MRRRHAIAGLASAALLPLRARAQERVLTVVAPWELSSLEPGDTGYIAARMGIAETLVGVEPDGTLVGLLAEGWAVDPDQLTWRFTIRAGRRFHDGAAVTPAIVADTLDRARKLGESMQALPIASVTAEGGDVVIRTATPFAPLPRFMTDYAGIVLAPASYGRDGRTIAWIGSGPYRLLRTEADRLIELEAVDHPDGRPAIARVRYVAAVQGETRAAMAESGDGDVVFTLLPAAAARVQAGGRARVERMTIPRLRMLAFNCALPQFSDVRTRRAISFAIDRAGIAAAILRHPPSAASQLFPPVLQGWHDPALPPLRQDVAQARALLAEAGWSPGPDGVLQKGGTAFRFDVLVPSNRPELPPMAAAIQAQLAAVGIAMVVKSGPTSAIPQAHRDARLQAAFLSRTYVNTPEPIGTIIPDFTRDRTVWASDGWRDPAFDGLIAAYVAEFDEAGRAALRPRIARILQEELPVVPVSWSEHTVAVSPRVTGVQIDPYETRYLIQRMSWAGA